MSTICFELTETGSKYGIRVDGTHIIAISEFTDGNIPEFFEQITQEVYYSLIANVTIFSKYEGGQLVHDNDLEQSYIENQNANIRIKKQNEVIELQQKISMLELLGENSCKNYYQEILNQKVQEYQSQYPTNMNCSNI